MDELKGFRYADGVHWYWKNKEVAIIDERGEIEWTVHKHTLPDEIITKVRGQRPIPSAKWEIAVYKVDESATQGHYRVDINGEPLMVWGGKKVRVDNGWEFDIPDGELGRLVYASFWHKLDDVYHYSDKAKDVFYPNWREGNTND